MSIFIYHTYKNSTKNDISTAKNYENTLPCAIYDISVIGYVSKKSSFGAGYAEKEIVWEVIGW